MTREQDTKFETAAFAVKTGRWTAETAFAFMEMADDETAEFFAQAAERQQQAEAAE
jgi:hypothetical protein